MKLYYSTILNQFQTGVFLGRLYALIRFYFRRSSVILSREKTCIKLNLEYVGIIRLRTHLTYYLVFCRCIFQVICLLLTTSFTRRRQVLHHNLCSIPKNMIEYDPFKLHRILRWFLIRTRGG